MCIRTVLKKENKNLYPVKSLGLSDIEQILPPDILQKLKSIYVCGNYGDAILAPDCLEIFKYLRENARHLYLELHTNGSLQSRAWWQELAEVIGENGHVTFGIDGLHDTHSVYRVGTDYGTVLENAGAFIDAGGRAHWRFIVFEYNEHQVDHAREHASKIGFKKFELVKSNRFARGKARQSASLQPPEQAGMRSAKRFDSNLESKKIVCRAIQNRKVYVSAEGLAFPCCQVGLIYNDNEFERSQVLQKIAAAGGREALDARKKSLLAIAREQFFVEQIAGSWGKASFNEGKLQRCAKTCGIEPGSRACTQANEDTEMHD